MHLEREFLLRHLRYSQCDEVEYLFVLIFQHFVDGNIVYQCSASKWMIEVDLDSSGSHSTDNGGSSFEFFLLTLGRVFLGLETFQGGQPHLSRVPRSQVLFTAQSNRLY